MKVTTINTINNLQRLSLTLGLTISLPFVITNKFVMAQPPLVGRVIDITAPNVTTQNPLVNSNTPVTNNNRNMPPLPTKQPATEVILINAKLTPPSPTSTGKAIASNRRLPTPPVISEPYRKNDQNNPIEEINSPISNNNNTNNNIAIQTSPPLTTTPLYGNAAKQRRNLADIVLVAPNVSNSSSPPGFPPQNTVTNVNNTQAYNKVSNRYKVIVEFKNSYQESQIRSLYPSAFRVTYNGRYMLQVGLFSSKKSADQVLQSLRNNGLNAFFVSQ